MTLHICAATGKTINIQRQSNQDSDEVVVHFKLSSFIGKDVDHALSLAEAAAERVVLECREFRKLFHENTNLDWERSK